MFFRIKPDIYASRGVIEEPRTPGFSETFMTGAILRGQPPVPLTVRSNFDANEPPRGFEGMSIPLWSRDFVDLLRGIGLNNFDLYDAIIEGQGGVKWTGYYAANVLGAVAAANMSKSQFTKIVSTPSGTPMASFQELVIDTEKAAPFDMFRLAESMLTLVVSERVTRALAGSPRPGGWGITAFPIREA